MDIELLYENTIESAKFKEYKLSNVVLEGECCSCHIRFTLNNMELAIRCEIPKAEYYEPLDKGFDYIKRDVLISGFHFDINDFVNYRQYKWEKDYTVIYEFTIWLGDDRINIIWDHLLTPYYQWLLMGVNAN